MFFCETFSRFGIFERENKKIRKKCKKALDKWERMVYNNTENKAEFSALTHLPRAVRLIKAFLPFLGAVAVPCGDLCLCTVIFFAWRCLTISAKEKENLLNEEITAKEVRLIGANGETLGIMSSDKALEIAYDQGMDLVLMSGQAVPPVCKIMDYGKFRFEREKREKEAKKKQQTIELKEIQLSCRIDTHDFETKANHARRFLSDGNKVRVVMKFKGREMSHMSIGKEILEKFEAACSELGTVDKKPVLDGRFMSMVISPVKAK